MSATNSLIAVDPAANATVAASAGSGKTWLLVTRIIRLLMDGAAPGGILALTFTRKAAAEMQLRLQQRLQQLATTDDAGLDRLLEMTGSAVSSGSRARARRLYENVMHADFPVRLQTFHSFCQDILSAFPLEAEVPPGFELLEDTALLQQEARERLFAETTDRPDDELSRQFDVLMRAANGPENTSNALDSILDQRSDWWAFTEGQPDPVRYAIDNLLGRLAVDPGADPYADFFRRVDREQLRLFADMLRRHATISNAEHASLLEAALESEASAEAVFNRVAPAFLTGSQTPRVRKASNAMAKSLGESGQTQFLELHKKIAGAALDCLEILRRQHTLRVNTAWYLCGHRYIEHYQSIKQNLRVLDFSDLEWACCRLLKGGNNAHWVQFKVDQRIDHVLIDEFQDTNPTQWQLILPVLEEIGAGDPERARSIFLVGDEKQSIYQFRRANPALQKQASDWLAERMDARATPLDASRRSSPAIMQAVNAVFGHEAARSHMPGFSPHSTHLDTPGEVTLLPMFQPPEAEAATGDPHGLRNPMLQPRAEASADKRQLEAEHIAALIQQLVDDGTPVSSGTDPHAPATRLNYGDIMLLFRNRTHINCYEEALRRRAIPFLGSQRGGLLDSQEIVDIEALLNSLITPYHNLDIAQILKSPVFDASDDDLVTLALMEDEGYWYQRLQSAAAQLDERQPLRRAARLLPRWQSLAVTLPVHDLLDRIYAEGNIIERYAASVDESQRQRVAANLQRFHEMSLDHNSGRYPGLSHFLQHLQNIRSHSRSLPDEPVQQSESRVNMMTIHASKGLEAPVVILADADSKGTHSNAWTTLVDWPADHDRPAHLQLLLDSKSTDAVTNAAIERRIALQAREEFNLLYVALTRARQYLYVSATHNAPQYSSGWYDLIRQGLGTLAEPGEDGRITVRHGRPVPAEASEPPAASPEPAAPAGLLDALHKPLAAPATGATPPVRPSRSGEEDAQRVAGRESDSDGLLRGSVIHRMLELLSVQHRTVQGIRQLVCAEFALSTGDRRIEEWMREADATYRAAELDAVFRPEAGALCRNEVPVVYSRDGATVRGIIDRIVIQRNRVLVIDYKTNRVENDAQVDALTGEYRAQLSYYAEGIRRMWPGRTVTCGLVFTRINRLVYLQE